MINNKKKVEILGRAGNRLIERTNALTLAHDSREYYDYYKKGRPDKMPDISKVSYFLLMRSLELALKALLKVKEGVPTVYLKDKLKHNVDQIYSYCVQRKYLKSLNRETKIALEILSSYYKDKDFEYTKIGYKSLPHTTYLIPLIENIHDEIKRIFNTTGIEKYI